MAASNSKETWRASWNAALGKYLICDGVADNVEIQAAVDALPVTGGCIFLLDGTFTLAAQVLRAIDDVKFMGCGNATLLNLDGVTPVITAGVQDGWLFTHFASDAGGPSIAAATQSAIRSVWIAGVRTDDPAAAAGGDAVITVAANNTPAAQKARADFTCAGANDDATIEALVAAGVTVKLMVGSYVFGASLNIMVSNFRLEGSGPGTVISGVINVSYIEIGDGSTALDNITVCDLRIDGTDQTLKHGIGCFGGVGNLLTNINILNCNVTNNTQSGIQLEYAIYCHIIGNSVTDVGNQGINMKVADYTTCTGNITRGCSNGIKIFLSKYCAVTGNTCDGNNVDISLAGATYNTISVNTMQGATTEGMTLYSDSDYNTITGNIFHLCGNSGLNLNAADHNVIVGNFFLASSQMTDNTYPNMLIETADYNLIEANICRQGAEAWGPNYGIYLAADADHNIVRNNDLYDSGKTGPILDLGVDTEFNNITFQFIQGTTFISADGSAKGWEIDLDTEFAIALGQLPLELTQVVRIKIWAVGLAAPGAGNGMTLEININAGQDDEAYTAEAIAVANKVNTTDNFAVNDIIHWVLTAADDADIGDLIGGDSLEVKVKHEAAVAADIATDAILRAVEIEYVT